MIGRISPSNRQPKDSTNTDANQPRQSIQQAQDVIYNFLMEIVNHWHPKQVLQEFNQLFVMGACTVNSEVQQALWDILLSQNEAEFRFTLKRCFYILINNWYGKRQYQFVKTLIQSFEDIKNQKVFPAPENIILGVWLNNFLKSKEYPEIKLYASPETQVQDEKAWSNRYTSYLLVTQYITPDNPVEQREAAKNLSKRLKDKLKFDLAMYTARCESPRAKANQQLNNPNPTQLGDTVVHLIKLVISKQRVLSFSHQAEAFLLKTQGIRYEEFKELLPKYLMFSMSNDLSGKLLNKKLAQKLETLYNAYNVEILNKDLLLRTCNRLIEYVTTEDGQHPSPFFISLINQKNTLTLVIILLKIILICQYSRTHLEVCIAQLIRYYENYSEQECKWLINFLEIFNLVFAITADNVQYNLVKIKSDAPDHHLVELDAYRVFSQLKATDWRGQNLTAADLSQTDLSFAKLSNTDLRSTFLQGSELIDADLNGANLSGADLNHADLRRAELKNANLSGANLTGAFLRRGILIQANLSKTILLGANLSLCDLTNALLWRANLQGANLSEANFTEANLSEADLKDANLHRAKFYHANLSAAKLFHGNLNDANLVGANLTGANLNQANLNYGNLIGANLSHALLRRCSLCYSRLSHTNLSDADLSRADLSHADLSNANLSNSSLRNAKLGAANLSRADLRGANLFRADLSHAKLEGTRFGRNAALSADMKEQFKQCGAIFDESNTID